MFTGLVETVGEISKIQVLEEGKELFIKILFKNDDVQNGDSININGVCLTVTSIQEQLYSFYCSYKTLELTNLGDLSENHLVNVERSLTLEKRIGGHLVTGHIDSKTKIISVLKKENTFLYQMKVESFLTKYIVKKGSITLDGISLTVVDIKEEIIEILLIPETIKKTNVQFAWKVGKWINVEIDIMARHIEKLLFNHINQEKIE